MTIFIQFLTSQSQLDKANGDYVVMIDGARVPVASRKRDMLLELFDGIK